MAERIWEALSNEISSTVASAGRSVVTVYGRRHPASGVVLNAEAIVTVNHALRRDEEISVVLENGARTAGRVAGRDAGTDLAVVRLEQAITAPAPKWSDAAKLRLGDFVL